jgi:putative ABC transport system permease protein
MLKNYFSILTRHLWKSKFSSILNMLGLAMGMACYLLIFHYVSFEFGYDRFHGHEADIYRLQRDVYENNVLKMSLALTSYNIGPAMKAEFPEVKEVVRCSRFLDNMVSYGDKKYNDESIIVCDASIFKVFSFRLLKGDPENALKGPNRVAVTAAAARRYFGDGDPMGKTIQISSRGKNYNCMVSGVFQDVPQQSHLKFDMLMSLSTRFGTTYSDWIFSTVFTYFLLTPDADPQSLAAKFPGFIDKYILQHVPRSANWQLILQPLREIYLYSDLTYDTENGNGEMVYFLLIIGFLVLVISWINYTNLSTARAMERAREVGIRKVLGSDRRQLIRQFLAESLLVNIVPILIAVILVIFFIPFLRDLVGKNIPLYLLYDFRFWLNIAGLYVIGSLLSGLYPAFVLSSFKPITFLKHSKLTHTAGGSLLRKVLVGFQLAASVVLLIVTFTVYRQIQYMRQGDLGMNIDRLVAVKLPSVPINTEYIMTADSFKTELLKYPAVRYVSSSGHIPGSDPPLKRLAWLENTEMKQGKVQSILFVDEDFVPAYQLRMTAGRNFSREYGTDSSGVIINEESAKLFGFKTPEGALNQNIFLYGYSKRFKIIGVIKDYHHRTLKKSHEPIIFQLNPIYKSYYSLKLSTPDISGALRTVRDKWAEIFPGYPFDYFFMTDHFDRQYRAESQFGKVLGIFVLLTIIITCLGLLGLSYFGAVQRTREIGIRKAIGASVGDILVLLTRDFVRLSVVAAVIAWPIAYYIVHGWLQDYPFRISIPWLFFIVAGLILGFITLATMAYHTLKAAHGNPVDALREE